jgi:hypothetical protein
MRFYHDALAVHKQIGARNICAAATSGTSPSLNATAKALHFDNGRDARGPVADGVLTMRDENGTPTGKNCRLGPDDDERVIASRLKLESSGP